MAGMKAIAQGLGLSTAYLGKEANFVLYYCTDTFDPLDCIVEIKGEEDGSYCCKRITPESTKNLDLSFQRAKIVHNIDLDAKVKEGEVYFRWYPTHLGKYQIYITLEGENIKGSPFNALIQEENILDPVERGNRTVIRFVNKLRRKVIRKALYLDKTEMNESQIRAQVTQGISTMVTNLDALLSLSSDANNEILPANISPFTNSNIQNQTSSLLSNYSNNSKQFDLNLFDSQINWDSKHQSNKNSRRKSDLTLKLDKTENTIPYSEFAGIPSVKTPTEEFTNIKNIFDTKEKSSCLKKRKSSDKMKVICLGNNGEENKNDSSSNNHGSTNLFNEMQSCNLINTNLNQSKTSENKYDLNMDEFDPLLSPDDKTQKPISKTCDINALLSKINENKVKTTDCTTDPAVNYQDKYKCLQNFFENENKTEGQDNRCHNPTQQNKFPTDIDLFLQPPLNSNLMHPSYANVMPVSNILDNSKELNVSQNFNLFQCISPDIIISNPSQDNQEDDDDGSDWDSDDSMKVGPVKKATKALLIPESESPNLSTDRSTDGDSSLTESDGGTDEEDVVDYSAKAQRQVKCIKPAKSRKSKLTTIAELSEEDEPIEDKKKYSCQKNRRQSRDRDEFYRMIAYARPITRWDPKNLQESENDVHSYARNESPYPSDLSDTSDTENYPVDENRTGKTKDTGKYDPEQNEIHPNADNNDESKAANIEIPISEKECSSSNHSNMSSTQIN